MRLILVHTNCDKCQQQTLVSTFEQTGGFCLPCKNGTNPPNRSVWQKLGLGIGVILMIIGSPALLVLGVLLGLVVLYVMIHNFVVECLFRYRMWACKRFLNRRKLSVQIAAAGGGTLILDTASVGTSYIHSWWTQDDIQNIMHPTPPTDDEYVSSMDDGTCPEWDKWLWEKYINPIDGAAHLVNDWNSRKLERWLRNYHPNVIVVHTWSGVLRICREHAA